MLCSRLTDWPIGRPILQEHRHQDIAIHSPMPSKLPSAVVQRFLAPSQSFSTSALLVREKAKNDSTTGFIVITDGSYNREGLCLSKQIKQVWNIFLITYLAASTPRTMTLWLPSTDVNQSEWQVSQSRRSTPKWTTVRFHNSQHGTLRIWCQVGPWSVGKMISWEQISFPLCFVIFEMF